MFKKWEDSALYIFKWETLAFRGRSAIEGTIAYG